MLESTVDYSPKRGHHWKTADQSTWRHGSGRRHTHHPMRRGRGPGSRPQAVQLLYNQRHASSPFRGAARVLTRHHQHRAYDPNHIAGLLPSKKPFRPHTTQRSSAHGMGLVDVGTHHGRTVPKTADAVGHGPDAAPASVPVPVDTSAQKMTVSHIHFHHRGAVTDILDSVARVGVDGLPLKTVESGWSARGRPKRHAAPRVLTGYSLLEEAGVELPEEVVAIALADQTPPFTDVDMGHMLSFIHLNKLDVSGNRLQLWMLSTLPALERLSLSCNNLGDVPVSPPQKELLPLLMHTTEPFRSLQVLDLSHNHITPEVLGRLSSLPHLKELNADYNNLEITPESQVNLKGFQSLVSLSVAHNRLGRRHGWTAFGDLPKLTELDVSGNRIRAIPEDLAGFQSLRALNLSNNRLTDDRNVAQLRCLPLLELLDIHANPLVPALPLHGPISTQPEDFPALVVQLVQTNRVTVILYDPDDLNTNRRYAMKKLPDASRASRKGVLLLSPEQLGGYPLLSLPSVDQPHSPPQQLRARGTAEVLMHDAGMRAATLPRSRVHSAPKRMDSSADIPNSHLPLGLDLETMTLNVPAARQPPMGASLTANELKGTVARLSNLLSRDSSNIRANSRLRRLSRPRHMRRPKRTSKASSAVALEHTQRRSSVSSARSHSRPSSRGDDSGAAPHAVVRRPQVAGHLPTLPHTSAAAVAARLKKRREWKQSQLLLETVNAVFATGFTRTPT